MSTLTARPRTALLVIDVQNGVVSGAHERDEVVANIGALVDRARRESVPVVWVQHSSANLVPGSDEWRYVPELARDASEPLVPKTFPDSFEDTDLEDVLAGAGVGHLVVTGAQTDECIRATIHGAFVRGYDVTLVGDAHDGGPERVGSAATGQGDRAHEPLLAVPHRARPYRGRDGREGRDVQRTVT